MLDKTAFLLIATWVVAAGISHGEDQSVKLIVDGARPGQTWEGWGTTDMFSFDGLQVEPEANKPGIIPAKGREAVLKLYYGELGMNRVRFWPMGYEPENDDDDPRNLRWERFVWEGRGTRPVNSVNPFCEDHLVSGRKYRSKNEPFVFYPATHQWENWMTVKPESPMWFWGKDAKFNPDKVEEYAEHALAAVLHIKRTYGYQVPFWSLFNEPSNTAKVSKETTLALVLACGRRFKENGLATKLVICDDVTPEASAEAIEYVLANEEARGYVGAVSYHRYCGDFVLETVKPLLARVGKGDPLVVAPVSFYKSAFQYGKSVWLSEQCSYGDEGITHFDAGRARANHICDEINHGKVNAFDFMVCYFIERGRPGNEETPIFLRFKDARFASAEINAFGHWIRHFTRYIRPGMTQLRTQVDDKLVKAAAFRDGSSGTLVVVVVNNHPEAVDLAVELCGVAEPVGKVERSRTSPGKLGEDLPEIRLSGGTLSDRAPGTSITTYTLEPA